MMQKSCAIILLGLCVVAAPATASSIKGPARFCGYSPIIDLKSGEKIQTLQGGIHGGSFRWYGAFGSLIVHGIGWASRPEGRLVVETSDGTPGRFAARKNHGKYSIAIWNGRQGAAYFESPTRFTRLQIAAIERVRLFQEGEEPLNCDLRTVFAWDSYD